jgi:adenosylcobinamide-GDP ribazoletransferase
MFDEPDHIPPVPPAQSSVHMSHRAYWSLWLFEQYKELIAAIRFLSTVPIPGSAQLFQTDSANPRLVLGSAYFPLVGLLLALLLSILPLVLGPYVPPLVLAASLVIALVFLTGGLHLDGLMDTCDGIFGGAGRERKLEIMRDSRVGSFGVLGGVCLLLLKFALFASLDLHLLLWSLLLVLPVSRWAMVLAMRQFPSARSTGLGAAFRQTVSLRRLCVAARLSSLCC